MKKICFLFTLIFSMHSLFASECKFVSEASLKSLEDGSMAQELNLDNERFRALYVLIFEFLKAGGKGRLVKYIETKDYGLSIDSGPYLIVSEFPSAPLKDSYSLWLRTDRTFNKIEKIFQRVPVILGDSLLLRASVDDVRDSHGLSVINEFKRCGFLQPQTQFAFFLTRKVTEAVAVHENVHLDDDLGGLSKFFKRLDFFRESQHLDEDALAAIKSFVMEQRAYNVELSFIKNQKESTLLEYSQYSTPGQQVQELVTMTPKQQFAQELAVAKNTFDTEYTPETKKVLLRIRDQNPSLFGELAQLIRENLMEGPFHPQNDLFDTKLSI